MFSVILDFEKWLVPKIGVYKEIYFLIVKDLEQYRGNVCYIRSAEIRHKVLREVNPVWLATWAMVISTTLNLEL